MSTEGRQILDGTILFGPMRGSGPRFQVVTMAESEVAARRTCKNF